MSQQEVAEALGMSRTNYNSYERGHQPRLTTVVAISKSYSCTLDQLILQDLSKLSKSALRDFAINWTPICKDVEPMNPPSASVALDDYSPMPWGMHKGANMIDVPDDYLKLMYRKGTSGPVKVYIEEAFDQSELK